MDINTIALITGVIVAVFSILIPLVGIGVQYGIYTSFKTQTEIAMTALTNRLTLVEEAAKNQEISHATLLAKVEGLKESTEKNVERILKKLDNQDEHFNKLFSILLGKNKNQ